MPLGIFNNPFSLMGGASYMGAGPFALPGMADGSLFIVHPAAIEAPISRRFLGVDRFAPRCDGGGGSGNSGGWKETVKDRAIRELKRTAVNRPEGSIPTKVQILAAVTKEYKGYYGKGGQLASYEIKDLEALAANILAGLDQVRSDALGITGRKPKPVKNAPLATEARRKEKVAFEPPLAGRVLTALSLLPEIERSVGNIPAHYALQLEAAGEITPETLLRSAEAAASRLSLLGEDEGIITKNLADEKAKKAALLDTERLEEVRAEVRAMFHDSTIFFDKDGIKRFLGFIEQDIVEWMNELPPELKPSEKIFRKFIENYVGFWMSETEGRSPSRLTISNEVIVDAIIKTKRGAIEEFPPAFDELAKGMVEYIVSKEFLRDRLVAPSAEASGSKQRPVFTRAITCEEDLGAQIGDELLAKYKEFFDDIINGKISSIKALRERERHDLALRWREAFIYITRFGVGNYGDNYNEAHIMEFGLEPSLVRPLFRRIKDEKVYTDQVLELMREFYLSRIQADESKVPPISELKPAFLQNSPAGKSSEDKIFIPYGPAKIEADGMAGYVAGMEFVPKYKDEIFSAEFESATGISWERFIGYGTLRRNTPKDIPAKVYETVKIPDGETLTNDQLWQRYIYACKEEGHIEDVTVSPNSETAYLGILKAFRFLSERAQKQGRFLDVIDYISAISPVVRRLRGLGQEGVILLGIPSFMRSVPFRNIGQPTFTRQVKAEGLLTLIKESTAYNWMSGEGEAKTRNPTYALMRKVAESLSSQAHGGRDVAENIYNLQVMFRYMFILENYASILNPLGGREDFSSEEQPTRFVVRIVSDRSRFERGEKNVSEPSDEIVLKARSGYYGRLLEGVRDYLTAIQSLPFPAETSLSDGRSVSIGDYLTKLVELESRHAFDSTALKDQTSLLSADRIDEIKLNYKRLEGFAQEAYFFLRVRGTALLKDGTEAAFDAAPRIEGYRYDSSSIGRLVLFIDDAQRAAQREGWSGERKNALLMMRIIARHSGESRNPELDPDFHRDDVKNNWPLPEGLFDQAVSDFTKLEEEAKGLNLKDKAGDVTKIVGGGEHQKVKGPILPWWVPGWTEQFKQFASARGAKKSDAEKIERALTQYFSNVKGFYSQFWPNTLRKAIDKQFTEKSLADSAFELAKEFLPAVGMMIEPHVETSEKLSRDDIAKLSLLKYADFFNMREVLDEQIPVDESLLRDITNLYCIEFNELEATLTFESAKRLLTEFNAGKRASPLVIAGEEARPAYAGADMEVWQRIVEHERYGFVQFVRSKYRAPYFSDEGLSEFAASYAEADDIFALSYSAVESAYAPYKEIEDKMARFHRILLASYLEFLDDEFSTVLGLTADAIREVAAESLPSSADELLNRALKPLVLDKTELDEIEKFNAVLKAVTGKADNKKAIGDLVEDIFNKKIEPMIREKREQIERWRTELGEKEKEILDFRGEVASFSLEQFLVRGQPADEEACRTGLSSIEQGLKIIAGLQGRIAAINKAVERAEDIALELDTIESAETLRTAFTEDTAILEGYKYALEADKAALNAELDAFKLAKKRRAAMEQSARYEAELDAIIAERDALLQQLQRTGVALAWINTKIDKFEIDFTTYNSFYAGKDEIAKILDEDLVPVERLFIRQLTDYRRITSTLPTAELPSEHLLSSETVERIASKRESIKDKVIIIQITPESIMDKSIKKIKEAEAKLPVSPLYADNNFPELPDGETMIVEGAEMGFTKVQPAKNYRPFIVETMKAITSARVVSAENASHLFPEHEAAKLEGRKGLETIKFKDIFGKEREFSIGAFVVPQGKSPDFEKVKRAFEFIASMNSYEGYLIATLLNKKMDDAVAPLIASLFVAIAKEPEVQSVDEAKRLARRWALSVCINILDVFPKKAEHLFEVVSDKRGTAQIGKEASESVKWWEKEFGADYSTEEMEKDRLEMMSELDASLWGRLVVEMKVDELARKVFFLRTKVDPVQWREFTEGKRETVLVYDPKNGSFKDTDIRKPLPQSDPFHFELTRDELIAKSKYEPPIADDPEELAQFETFQKIFGDTSLRPLAWVLRQTKEYDGKHGTDIFGFICREFLRGEDVDMLKAQDNALVAYRRYFVGGFIETPEVQSMPQERVVKWFESHVKNISNRNDERTAQAISNAISRVKQLSKDDPNVLGFYRMMMILIETAFQDISLSAPTPDEEHLHYFIASASTDKSASEWKKLFAEMKEFYMQHRDKVLSDRPKLRSITGSARPYRPPKIWDKSLNTRFPETGWVSFGTLVEAIASAKHEELAIYDAGTLFPEFQYMAALIYFGYKLGRLPASYRVRLTTLMTFFNERIDKAIDDEMENSIMQNLIEVYDDARPEILKMLADVENPAERQKLQKRAGDFDLSILMLKERAWEDAKWKSPMDRLKAVVPEYFMMNPRVFELYGESLRNDPRSRPLATRQPEAMGFMLHLAILSLINGNKDIIDNVRDIGSENDIIKYVSRPELVAQIRQLLDSTIQRDEKSGHLVVNMPGVKTPPEYITALNKKLLVPLGAKPGQKLREVLLAEKPEEKPAERQAQTPVITMSKEDVEMSAWWQEVYGRSFTDEARQRMLKTLSWQFKTAIWGHIFIPSHDKQNTSTHLVVEPESYSAYKRGDAKNVILNWIDEKEGEEHIIEVDLADFEIPEKERFKFTPEELNDARYFPPHADDPKAMVKQEVLKKILYETLFRPLSYILYEIGSDDSLGQPMYELLAACENELLAVQTEFLRAFKESSDIRKSIEHVRKRFSSKLKAFEAKPVNWKGTSPLARLKAVVPEFFKLKIDVAHSFLRLGGRNMVKVGMEKNPDMARVFTLLSIIPHSEEELDEWTNIQISCAVATNKQAVERSVANFALRPLIVYKLRKILSAKIATDANGRLFIDDPEFKKRLEKYPEEVQIADILLKAAGAKEGQTVAETILEEEGVF